MKTALTILAGLLAGVLVALGVIAAFVFVGPAPVGLRPTSPPSAAPSVAPSSPPSEEPGSPAPSGSVAASGSPAASGPVAGSGNPGAVFHIGQPAPALVVPQVGGGVVDLAALRGKPVWLTFMQTTCSDCAAAVPLMTSFAGRYGGAGLVVVAVDIREAEATVAGFAQRLNATFPIGLDADGKVQATWGTYTLPIHFWIDKAGIVRDGASGAVSADVVAAGVGKILPGVAVTP